MIAAVAQSRSRVSSGRTAARSPRSQIGPARSEGTVRAPRIGTIDDDGLPTCTDAFSCSTAIAGRRDVAEQEVRARSRQRSEGRGRPFMDLGSASCQSTRSALSIADASPAKAPQPCFRTTKMDAPTGERTPITTAAIDRRRSSVGCGRNIQLATPHADCSR